MDPVRPATTTMGKRLWHLVRVVYYMLRKSISKHKLVMDLHLLLKRGKLAGKALTNLMAIHHHHHHAAAAASFSCRSIDPNTSFYNPRGVEFSCGNTPSFPSLHAPTKRKHKAHYADPYKCDAAAIAKAFEILNSEFSDAESSVAASPSPWGMGKSPVVGRQLRITDSPFPIREEGEGDGRIDKEAEDFIRRFYEQLRRQQLLPPTPEYGSSRRPVYARA